jgi:hypothetical protein
MRLSALACVAALAMPAFAASPAHAMALPGKAAVGREIIARTNGRRLDSGHRYGHRYGHHHRGFYRDGYHLMYAVHGYPRGIVATFGYPRCFCYSDR